MISGIYFRIQKMPRKNFGFFPEQLVTAGAYQGEILGLVAIHFILMAVNKANTNLQGRDQIYSDCMGAFGTVVTIPLNRIPCRCKHSLILKNIMVNSCELTFFAVTHI